MEGYAAALREIRKAIADNGGYDRAALITELRAEHAKGNTTLGLNMQEGAVGSMKDLGIL